MIVKMYRVFDKLFISRQDAEREIEGWEHKESIKEYWVAVASLADVPKAMEFDELFSIATAFGTELGQVVREYEEERRVIT